jgi:2-amino-4-hydroxy-6-hydroxymethyldihydropteridine diphosphokinase
MAIAFLGFGSNMGDRLQNFKKAQEILESFEVRFLEWAPIYETEPVAPLPEDAEQAWYLNSVAKVEIDHSAWSLFLLGKEVEANMGRSKTTFEEEGVLRYFPRIIDVDLLMYDNDQIEMERLQVPHPRFHLRKYDLTPFADLAPTLIHPVFNKTIQELLLACADSATVRVYSSSLSAIS